MKHLHTVWYRIYANGVHIRNYALTVHRRELRVPAILERMVLAQNWDADKATRIFLVSDLMP